MISKKSSSAVTGQRGGQEVTTMNHCILTEHHVLCDHYLPSRLEACGVGEGVAPPCGVDTAPINVNKQP